MEMVEIKKEKGNLGQYVARVEATLHFHFYFISHRLSVVGLPPHCPQVVWCHGGEIGPFSATLAQDRLAECDQSEKNPLKYSSVAWN